MCISGLFPYLGIFLHFDLLYIYIYIYYFYLLLNRLKPPTRFDFSRWSQTFSLMLSPVNV